MSSGRSGNSTFVPFRTQTNLNAVPNGQWQHIIPSSSVTGSLPGTNLEVFSCFCVKLLQ